MSDTKDPAPRERENRVVGVQYTQEQISAARSSSQIRSTSDPVIVFAWGLTVGNEAFIYRPAAYRGSREYGIFGGAERAHALFSRVRPLRLIGL